MGAGGGGTAAGGEAGEDAKEGKGLGRVAVLPTKLVFLLPNSLVSADAETRARIRNEELILSPEAIALRHWAGSWLKHQLGLPVWSLPGDEAGEWGVALVRGVG